MLFLVWVLDLQHDDFFHVELILAYSLARENVILFPIS